MILHSSLDEIDPASSTGNLVFSIGLGLTSE